MQSYASLVERSTAELIPLKFVANQKRDPFHWHHTNQLGHNTDLLIPQELKGSVLGERFLV